MEGFGRCCFFVGCAFQISTPTLVRLSQRVRFVAAGASHSGLVVSGGLAYLCGSNAYGELGAPVGKEAASTERVSSGCSKVPPLSWSSRFLLLQSLQNSRIRMLALGKHFSVALTRSVRRAKEKGKKSLFAWGWRGWECCCSDAAERGFCCVQGEVFSWGLNDMNQLGVDPALDLPLSPDAGEDGPPPKAHSPSPLPLCIPPSTEASSAGGVATAAAASGSSPSSPSPSRVRFYLVVAGPYTAAAAGVRGGECLSEEALRAQGLDAFFRSVVVRSQSGVGWTQRKLSATASLVSATSLSAACSTRGLSSGNGAPLPAGGLQASPSFDGSASSQQQLPRLLTLSRGVSSAFGPDASLPPAPSQRPSPSGGHFASPLQEAFAGAAAFSAGRGADSQSRAASDNLFLALTVEDALRLIEGARSTGDSSHLRSALTQVFGNITRLNASFAFAGHGNFSDFEGLDLVYAQLSQEFLPLVAAGFMACVNAAVKRAEFLKRPDQLKFVLYMLMCTPLYECFCKDREGNGGQQREKRGSNGVLGSLLFGDAADAAPSSSPSAEEAPEKSAEGKTLASEKGPREAFPGELLYTALLLLIFRLPPEGKRSFLRLAREFPDAVFG